MRFQRVAALVLIDSSLTFKHFHRLFWINWRYILQCTSQRALNNEHWVNKILNLFSSRSMMALPPRPKIVTYFYHLFVLFKYPFLQFPSWSIDYHFHITLVIGGEWRVAQGNFDMKKFSHLPYTRKLAWYQTDFSSLFADKTLAEKKFITKV